MMITTYKAAEAIAGVLGRPSKMPGYAYGLPAYQCKAGMALTAIRNSVCSNCYALKGRYVFDKTQKAMEYRFNSLTHPQWVEALTFMIKKRGNKYFRWHDSGDLQGLWHLKNIIEVAKNCPEINFWLPTREYHIVRQCLEEIPPNLIVRVSGTMINGSAPSWFPHTSTVVSENPTCPSHKQNNRCEDCRACWDPTISNISYLRH